MNASLKWGTQHRRGKPVERMPSLYYSHLDEVACTMAIYVFLSIPSRRNARNADSQEGCMISRLINSSKQNKTKRYISHITLNNGISEPPLSVISLELELLELLKTFIGVFYIKVFIKYVWTRGVISITLPVELAGTIGTKQGTIDERAEWTPH